MLDPSVRAAAGRALARGSVTVTLRIGRATAASVPRVNAEALDAAVSAALAASELASRRGLDLAPMTAADLIGVRGVLESDASVPSDDAELVAAVASGVDSLFSRLATARNSEGAALAGILRSQLDRVEALVRDARVTAEARAGRSGALLRTRARRAPRGRGAQSTRRASPRSSRSSRSAPTSPRSSTGSTRMSPPPASWSPPPGRSGASSTS